MTTELIRGIEKDNTMPIRKVEILEHDDKHIIVKFSTAQDSIAKVDQIFHWTTLTINFDDAAKLRLAATKKVIVDRQNEYRRHKDFPSAETFDMSKWASGKSGFSDESALERIKDKVINKRELTEREKKALDEILAYSRKTK